MINMVHMVNFLQAAHEFLVTQMNIMQPKIAA